MFEIIDRVRSTSILSFSTLRGDLSLDCLPFVREWRLCAELDLWLVSSEAAPAVTQIFEYSFPFDSFHLQFYTIIWKLEISLIYSSRLRIRNDDKLFKKKRKKK